jgi:predicted enzyme related to lactoylglutathione lyase
MPNPIVHFEILGKDKQALEAFYTGIFDWQLTPVMDNYSTIFPGSGINGGIGTSMDGGAGHVTFYVEVANLAETLSTVESKGGKKLMEPEQVPNGPMIALFADPEGRVVGLVQAGTMRNG